VNNESRQKVYVQFNLGRSPHGQLHTDKYIDKAYPTELNWH